MRKLLSIFLIISGLIVIGIAVNLKVTTIQNQNKLISEYNQYLNTLKSMEENEKKAELASGTVNNDENNIEADVNINEDAEPEQSTEEIEENNEETNNTNTGNSKPDISKFFEGKQISGLINIPKINVSAAILEGTDDSALKYAVGHYPGLGNVGKPGNYVLLGHRNYVYGHFFRNLDKLEVGDEVIITKDEETYTYVVYESFVVKPEEVWVLEQTEDAIVTMITCTPIGTYTDRLIVRGALKTEGV